MDVNEFVQQEYVKYKYFMDADWMPEITISENANCNAYMSVYPYEIYNKQYILHIKILPNLKNEETRKNYCSLLFHEFTHIYDVLCVLNQNKNISYDDLYVKIINYTESHATYVELMKQCGFSKYTDHRILSEDTIVTIHNFTGSLNEIIKREYITAQDISNENILTYRKYLIEIKYFWGVLWFYNQYVAEYIIDYSVFKKSLRDTYRCWYSSIKTFNLEIIADLYDKIKL